MAETWINYVSGVPVLRDFMTTRGAGAPLCLNVLTGVIYYLAAGDVVTAVSIPTPPLTLISSQTLAAAAATVTFNNIPATYKDLIVSAQARSNTVAIVEIVRLTMNNDSGANYDYERENRLGTANGTAANFIDIGEIAAATDGANIGSTFELTIPNYKGTVFHKQARCYSERLNTVTPNNLRQISSGRWRNTAAITRLDFASPAGQFIIGSTFSLYGRG